MLEDEPRNVRAYHNLAAIAYTRGDLRRAESLERQALAIDPAYFEAWNTLGAIYVVEKRSAEALEALNKATALETVERSGAIQPGARAAGGGQSRRRASRGRQGLLAGAALLPAEPKECPLDGPTVVRECRVSQRRTT